MRLPGRRRTDRSCCTRRLRGRLSRHRLGRLARRPRPDRYRPRHVAPGRHHDGHAEHDDARRGRARLVRARHHRHRRAGRPAATGRPGGSLGPADAAAARRGARWLRPPADRAAAQRAPAHRDRVDAGARRRPRPDRRPGHARGGAGRRAGGRRGAVPRRRAAVGWPGTTPALADLRLPPSGSVTLCGWSPAWPVWPARWRWCCRPCAAPARTSRSWPQRSRPGRWAFAQRAALDLALVAFAAIAWFQLRQHASPLSGAGDRLGIDPLLATAPTVAVLAGRPGRPAAAALGDPPG